jgi:hypothetical protein
VAENISPAAEEMSNYDRLLESVPLDGAETVFVSGSRAEGWESIGSNYNFYVIGEPSPALHAVGGHSVPATDQRVVAHHYVVGDTRVIIYYWRPDDVEWAIAAVRHHELRPTVEIWPFAVQFLHRLRIGIPVRGKERFEELRAAVDPKLLSQYLTQNNGMCAETFWTDAVTRRMAGRLYDAMLQAQLAWGHAFDAYLASLGDTNPQQKWRHKRLARFEPDGLLVRDFEAAVCGPGPQATAADLDRFIVTLLHRCETLNCCVQLNCPYDALTISDPQPATCDIPIERATGSRLSRRYDGRVLALQLDGRAVELSPAAALVYGCADGRWSAVQIAKHAESYLDISADEAMMDVETVVRELSARGFLADPGRQ